MHCTHCGTINADHHVNCAKCGAPLNPYHSPTNVPSVQAGGPPAGGYRRVKTYLTESILVTLFCCQIGGIIGIVYAAQVDGHAARGDYAAAQRSSDTARTWCVVSLVIGLIANAIVFIALMSQGGRF